MKTQLSIQERLKDLRVEKGMTLEQLSQQTKIPACMVCWLPCSSGLCCCKFSRDLQNPGRAYFSICKNTRKPGNPPKY